MYHYVFNWSETSSICGSFLHRGWQKQSLLPHSRFMLTIPKAPIHFWLILLHCYPIFTFSLSQCFEKQRPLYLFKLLMVVSKTIISESLPHNNWECICEGKWNSFVIKAVPFVNCVCVYQALRSNCDAIMLACSETHFCSACSSILAAELLLVCKNEK